MRPVRMVVIGLSGYAAAHLQAVEWLAAQGLARLVGIVAGRQEQQRHPVLLQRWRSGGVAVFAGVADFLAAGSALADAVTVPVGIHEHAPITIEALRHGLHVYCEKPAAATVQEVEEMCLAQQQSGKKLAIGFQYLQSTSLQQMKSRVIDGRLGSVRKIKAVCGWPRSTAYYGRNAWAGRLRAGEAWVLDSPANNACAHFLMNMLFLAGKPAQCAQPLSVQAELFRANRIECADLCALRLELENGVAGFAIFAHCGEEVIPPRLEIACERGTAVWEATGRTSIHYDDGAQEQMAGESDEALRNAAFLDFVQAIDADRPPRCTARMAKSHTLCINAMHESCRRIGDIAPASIVVAQGKEDYPPYRRALFRRVKKLDRELQKAFAEEKLFSEIGTPWATGCSAAVVSTRSYDTFPAGPFLEN